MVHLWEIQLLGVTDLPQIPSLDANLTTSVPLGFIPDTEAADQYRCFITDIDIEEPVYLKGSHVIAGSPQVHHVLMYAVDKNIVKLSKNSMLKQMSWAIRALVAPILMGQIFLGLKVFPIK